MAVLQWAPSPDLHSKASMPDRVSLVILSIFMRSRDATAVRPSSGRRWKSVMKPPPTTLRVLVASDRLIPPERGLEMNPPSTWAMRLRHNDIGLRAWSANIDCRLWPASWNWPPPSLLWRNEPRSPAARPGVLTTAAQSGGDLINQ